ncbi:hypothetical protein K0M31_007141 [Melipona bicolor]|uniref:Uncharacterized protein n=1 Tax=Melipona bicolor TaxID=60889 RepID=A0AA40FSD3_9HYME|nr:hypothetical protein K0M31_007141 [Melipona bicolor]
MTNPKTKKSQQKAKSRTDNYIEKNAAKKTEAPKIQAEQKTQCTKALTYEELLQQDKNLNQKIEDLQKGRNFKHP